MNKTHGIILIVAIILSIVLIIYGSTGKSTFIATMYEREREVHYYEDEQEWDFGEGRYIGNDMTECELVYRVYFSSRGESFSMVVGKRSHRINRVRQHAECLRQAEKKPIPIFYQLPLDVEYLVTCRGRWFKTIIDMVPTRNLTAE